MAIAVYFEGMKIVFLVFVFLVGCAYPKRSSDYQAEAPASGKALIYIYRTPTQIDSVNPDVPKFFINDEVVGKLAVGGYYVQAVDPGEVKIYYKDSFLGFYPWITDEIKLTAAPNQKYFIKFSIESIMRFVDFKHVSPAFGEDDIKSTHLLINE